MNKLFKNAFFSFFKNKLAIILLMIIVFLTTATFTMFNSATHAFKKSYDQVMTEGNRHEYTIKEQYNIDGDALFTDPKVVTDSAGNPVKDQEDVFTPKANATDAITFNKETYVIVDANAKVEFIYGWAPQFTGDTPLLIKASDVSSIATSANFKVYIPRTIKTGTFGDAPEIATTRNELAKLDALIPVDFSKEAATKLLSAGGSTGFSNPGITLQSFDFDAFKKSISDAYTNNVDHTVDYYQHYSFELDKAASGKAFSSLTLNPYEFSSKLDATGPITTWAGFNAPIRAILNGQKVDSFKNLKERASLALFAEVKSAKHADLIKEIQKRPELIYKDVESVEISTSSSKLFKVVKEAESQVDKIKIYEGRELSKPTSHDDLVAKFPEEIKKQYPTEGTSGFEKSSNEVAQTELTKMISDPSQIFDNGWSVFATSSTRTIRVVDPKSLEAIVSPTYAAQNNLKALTDDQINKVYADKEFMGMLNDAKYSFTEIKARLHKLVPDANKNIIEIGQTPFLITGIGVTPDFAFPIISQQSPIPNTKDQAIIYTNRAGYSRIKSAYQSAQTENYIAIGKASNVSQDAFDNALFNDDSSKGQIGLAHTEAYKSITWPSNISALEKYDSKDETILLSPSRITFLEKLNHTISSVSWIVTSLLVVFTAFIVSLVIKKQIDNRKKQLGILLANGYSKLEISTSMMIIGLIVAVIPAIIGYVAGHFAQFIFMDIFHNYWTLPIWQTQFSWITLLVTVVAPLVGMSLLAFIISLYSLRGRIPEILAGETNKNGAITSHLMKPMKWFGIKTKMGISMMFSNVGKLTIAFVAFAAAIIAMSVSINSVGKFDYARQKSEEATKYEYQVDLATPTAEGGLYSSLTLDSIFRDINNKGTLLPYFKDGKPNPDLANKTIAPFKAMDQFVGYTQYPLIHTASTEDDQYSGSNTTGKLFDLSMKDADFTYYPYYLKNRIQFKSLLDMDIQKGINPWRIASQMMPENQRNSADIADAKFIDYAAKKFEKDEPAIFNAVLQPEGFVALAGGDKHFLVKVKDTSNPDGYVYKIDPSVFSLVFSTEYRKMIANGLAWATYDYEQLRKTQIANNNYNNDKDLHLPYFMTYNQVLTDKGDEQYTYIDSSYFLKDANGNNDKRTEKIRGLDLNRLKAGRSQIVLSDSSIYALEHYLPSSHNGTVPIVINKYFAENYNVSKGSIINADLNNSVYRKLELGASPKVNYEIVGIENTYNEGKVYTLQQYANDVTGLTAIYDKAYATWSAKSQSSRGDAPQQPFNGVLTKYNDALIFKSAPLYSLSGVYPGKNQIKAIASDDDGYKSVNYGLFTPLPGQTAVPFEAINPKVKTIQDWITTYGDKETQSISPMQALYSSVGWTKVSDYQFNSIMDLASALMNTVQVIVMFIALAFVLLISTMIIADNTRFIATLKVMGYRTREISRIFLATFIPSLLLALIISVPIVFGLEEAIRVGIMGFGHVLIPLYIVGWEILLAFVILVVGFLAMYFISLRGLKNTSLLKAFQE